MKKLVILGMMSMLTACVERESVTLQAKDGVDGQSCVLAGTVLTCGDVVLDLTELASDGKDGLDGKDGVDGKDGSSCVATAVEEGVLITCGDSEEGFLIRHGEMGPKGEKGDTGEPGQDGEDGEDGASCYVDEAVGGAVIWCADGTSVFISHGKDGKDAESDDGDDDNDDDKDDDDLTCKSGKVKVCHKPGTPAEKTLCIAVAAVPAHLAQGGYLGSCVD